MSGSRTIYAGRVATLPGIAAIALGAAACVADPPSGTTTAPIVGGQNADAHEYRWMASLRATGDFHFCGGTLIAPRWVLTAAHCAVIPTASVVVGGLDVADPNDGERFTVSRTLVHPSFVSRANHDDVALLELDHAAGAPTATVNDDPHFPRGFAIGDAGATADDSTVIGWGDTQGVATTRLQEVEVPIVNNDSCNAQYATIGRTITAGMICAGHTNGGQDSCQGDSGGPLLSWSESEAMVAGITSWGRGCALPGFPGVYTRVSSYVPWIRDQGVPVMMKSDRSRAAATAELVGINNVSNHESERVQHLFELSPAGRLRHHYWLGGNWTPEDLFPAAPDTHGPPAVLTGASHGDFGQPTQNVFARASTGDLLHYWWINNAGWHLENLSFKTGFTQALTSNPVAINGPRFGDNGIASQHVFARGPNSTLLHFYWINNVSWRAENLTGVLATPDTLKPRGELAVVNAVNGVDPSGEQTRTQHVFARGSLDNLVHYWWLSTNNTWHVEDLTTGFSALLTIAGDPVAINGTGSGNAGVRTQDVFARAADGSLVHYYWINFRGWASENLTTKTGAGTAGLIAGTMQALNGPLRGNNGVMSQHVFARSTSGHLIHYWWVNFLGWQFEDLTATTGGTPITAPPQVTLGPGIGAGGIADINVFAQGSRGALIRYRRVEPGPWLADNLSAPAGSLAVRAHLVLLQGLERSASGIDALHVASKGTTQPVIYDWLDGMPWSSHLVN